MEQERLDHLLLTQLPYSSSDVDRLTALERNHQSTERDGTELVEIFRFPHRFQKHRDIIRLFRVHSRHHFRLQQTKGQSNSNRFLVPLGISSAVVQKKFLKPSSAFPRPLSSSMALFRFALDEHAMRLDREARLTKRKREEKTFDGNGYSIAIQSPETALRVCSTAEPLEIEFRHG